MGHLLLVGADSTIGQSVAKAFLEDEWEVWAIGRHPERFAPGVQWSYAVSNVADFEQMTRAAQALQQHLQAQGERQVDALVYTVGDILAQKTHEMGIEAWQRIMDANLTGAFVATRVFSPLFSPEPHLFYIGALTERLILPGLSAYATAKAGLEIFAQVVAKEQPRWKVTVVRPGAVATRFWERVPFRLPPKALQPEDVALRILEAYYNEHRGTLDIVPE
ncbi:MAG: SDR family NAD(P)-dependent oxidoreductase [Fimbriimonadales bacterium]|nr:SDR family NAD(P)-dependent oxidoreductase [Fimbriimonadales bacterium]MDW8051714.1 SDR family NAD(P)-dependent oxidoreductase [Armatimonadota bacterium]